MKVALVYDRVNKFGGAERVLLALHKIFPEAPLYTLVHQPKTATWSKDFNVIASPINSIPFFRTHHELLAPLAMIGFETLDLSAYDVVISITSEAAKAVITGTKTLHLCYCLTPTRYLWSGESSYSTNWKMKIFPQVLTKKIKEADIITAQRPDHYTAISKEVQTRIKNYYHRSADIIYPPVGDYFFTNPLIDIEKRNYYLVVSRLVPYKMVDLVVDAFNQLNLPLIIVGTGTEKPKLELIAKHNIKFVGSVTDTKLLSLYSHAKAVVFPQIEDFGIVPLEAQAAGTPVIAYAAGGALETIISKKTGSFFKKQTKTSLIRAITNHEANIHLINPNSCRLQAKKFTEARFMRQFSAKVEALWVKYQRLTH